MLQDDTRTQLVEEQQTPMERRRQARTPVNINALLIGEKTVPKGCRVINVSQYGMLLYCEADGRLSTFNDGDTVDIHLTVQHAGEQKKLTIPSYVRHVAENSVDVEFHHPDPILMDLIESYRVSDQHKLEAALGHNHSTTGKVTRLHREESDSAGKAAMEHPARLPVERKTVYPSLLALLFTLCVAAGGYVYTASIDNRIRSLESTDRDQSAELKDLQDRVFSTSLQEGRYASLNARITALGDAFAHLEDKITLLLPASEPANETGDISTPGMDNSPVTTTGNDQPGTVTIATTDDAPGEPEITTGAAITANLPGPANETDTNIPPVATAASAGTSGATAELAADSNASTATSATAGIPAPAPPVNDQTDTGNAQDLAQPADTVAAPDTTSTTTEPAVAAVRTGPWIINLVSSPDRNDVIRMARLATAAEIQTTIEPAEVRGKQYWRLQIGGYASLDEAKRQSASIKQALNIGEVWIFRRKH